MRSPRLLEVVRKQRAWLAVGVLVGLLLAVVHLVTTPRSYEATAGAYFSLEYGDSASDLVQGSTYAQNQVSSFALLVTTPAVLEPVAVDFGLTESSQAFAGRVSASAPLDSVVVEATHDEHAKHWDLVDCGVTPEQIDVQSVAGDTTLRVRDGDRAWQLVGQDWEPIAPF